MQNLVVLAVLVGVVKAIGETGTFTVSPTRTSVPVAVDQSIKRKSCPAEYQQVGKQCARTVYINPQVSCSNGGQLASDGTCVQYLGKNSECTAGFSRVGGLCVRVRTAAKQLTCPASYLLRSDNQCVRMVPLPDKEACPAGAQAKGTTCVVETTEEAQIQCPTGFRLDNKKCYIEESYDCTPTHTPFVGAGAPDDKSKGVSNSTEHHSSALPPLTTQPPRNNGATPQTTLSPQHPQIQPTQPPITLPTAAPISQKASFLGNEVQSAEAFPATTYVSIMPFIVNQQPLSLRLRRRRLQGVEIIFSATPAPTHGTHGAAGDQTTVVHEYVASSTCRRIRMQSAAKTCQNGILDGKNCRVSKQVAPILVPGGIAEEVALPTKVCPDGYSPSPDNDNLCMVQDEAQPRFFCPQGSEDAGDRCRVITKATTVCDAGFALEGKVCAQTQFVPLMVEYTVTYSCVGKECA